MTEPASVSRRTFLETSATTAAAALVARPVLGGPRPVPPSDRINVGYVGCGTQGLRQLMPALQRPDLRTAAVVDPNRKSEDYVEWSDSWGSFLFLRDMHTGAVWSAGHQPSGTEADSYEVEYAEDHAEFSRRDGSIATGLAEVVSTEHDAEIRRVALTNLGSRAREIELTSYAEIVLAPQADDVAHPAYQNLFVQTEFVPEIGALLATRRPRSRDEQPIWAAHVAVVEEEAGGVIQYETDRARFLGRGRSVRSPASVIDGRPLSNYGYATVYAHATTYGTKS